MISSRRSLALPAALVASLALAACGGGTATDTGGLSPQEVRGKQIARSAGCASCHGADGQGGFGPPWLGLVGAERQLVDGTVVVADDDYLVRSIRDPQAEVVAGYGVRMTANNLSDDQVLDVIAYIKTYSDVAAPAAGS